MRDIHSNFYLPCEIRSSLRLEFQDPGICVGTLGIRKLWKTFQKRFKRCGGGTQTSGYIRYPVLPACGVYKNNKSRFSAPRYSCKSQNVCIDICRYIYTKLGLHPTENSKCKPLQMKAGPLRRISGGWGRAHFPRAIILCEGRGEGFIPNISIYHSAYCNLQ